MNFNKYIKNQEDFGSLKAMAYDGEIFSTKCRWSLWRVFLKVFPLDSEVEIRKSVKIAREYYKKKLQEFQKANNKAKELEDPLSLRTNVIKFTIFIIPITIIY